MDQGRKETVVVGQLSGEVMYRFYKSLVELPKIIKEVVMNTACKGLQMNGFIAGLFRVELGEQTFSINIYVVPIGDEMLLGLDF